MLIVSVILAALVVLVANTVVRKTGRFGVVCVIAGLSMFLGLPCLMLPAVQLNGLLLLLIGLVCWFTKARPRVFLLCSLGAFFISHGVGSWVTYAEIREQAQLRQEYSSESLAERLAYEKRPSVPTRDGAAFAGGRANTQSDKDLARLEDRIDTGNPRTFMLRQLHEGAVDDFINSQGFGVSRRIRPRREYIELPESEPIPQPAASSPTPEAKERSAADQLSPPSEADALTAVPLQTALQEMHQDSVIDFANPKGFGYVRDREHVAGFQSHRFGAMPTLEDKGPETRRWQIERLELVSLLTHDEPMVYLSDHLPRMDELREARTRPLTAFEKTALGALEQGESLKLEATPDRILMLGSIRALKRCTSCHSVERGALLGAFSYVLRRE